VKEVALAAFFFSPITQLGKILMITKQLKLDNTAADFTFFTMLDHDRKKKMNQRRFPSAISAFGGF